MDKPYLIGELSCVISQNGNVTTSTFQAIWPNLSSLEIKIPAHGLLWRREDIAGPVVEEQKREQENWPSCSRQDAQSFKLARVFVLGAESGFGKLGQLITQYSMVQLILRWKTSKCKDPRDKVYGLYNLASDCCRDAIVVDYAMSISQLANMVARHYSQEHDNPITDWEFERIDRLEMWEGVIESWMEPGDSRWVLGEENSQAFHQELVNNLITPQAVAHLDLTNRMDELVSKIPSRSWWRFW